MGIYSSLFDPYWQMLNEFIFFDSLLTKPKNLVSLLIG